MAHYSEMDFLFSNTDNRNYINTRVDNQDNTRNIFNTDRNNNSYVVYKNSSTGAKWNNGNINTQGIKNYL